MRPGRWRHRVQGEREACGEARREGIPPGRAAANSPDLLMRMAREGAGICASGHDFAEPHVRSGELEPAPEE